MTCFPVLIITVPEKVRELHEKSIVKTGKIVGF
jgi:hypothetical protein